MSIWDDIENVGKSLGGEVGNTAKSLGMAVAAVPIGVAWNLAHLDDSFHGGWKHELLVTAGRLTDPIANQNTLTGAALAPVLEADRYVFSNYVQRPLSTAMIEASHISRKGNGYGFIGNWGELFDGSTWEKSWSLAKDQSLGQSIAFGLTNDKDPFNYQHPYQQVTWKDHPFLASALSGTIDGITSWYMDPLVIGGKLAMVGKEARLQKFDQATRDNGQVMQMMDSGKFKNRTQALVGNGEHDGFLANKTTAEIHQLPELKDHPRGLELAGMLEQANHVKDPATREYQQKFILAIANADQTTIQQATHLRDALTPEQVDRISNILKGSVTGSDEATVRDATVDDLQRLGLNEVLWPSKVSPENIAESERQLQNQQAAIDYLNSSREWFKRLVGEGDEGGDYGLAGSLKNIPAPNAQTFRNIGRLRGEGLSRSGKANTGYEGLNALIDNSVGHAVTSLYQYSPSMMPMRVIHGYVVKTAHAGHVFTDSFQRLTPDFAYDLNDPEVSWRKTSDLMKTLKVSPEAYAQYADKFSKATRPMGRWLVLRSLDRHAVDLLAAKHGMDPKDPGVKALMDALADKYDKHNAAFSAALRGHADSGGVYSATKNDQGVRIDFIDDEDVPVGAPVLETQNANHYYFQMPVAELDKVFRRYGSLYRATARQYRASDATGIKALADKMSGAALWGAEAKDHLFDTMVPAMDIANRIWKTLILLRLGYPVRVVGDDQMRALAALGTAVIRMSIEGTANLAHNIKRHVPLVDAGDRTLRLRVDELEHRVGTDELYAKNQLIYKRVAFLNKKLTKIKSVKLREQYQNEHDLLLANHPTNLFDAKKELDDTREALEQSRKKRKIGSYGKDIKLSDGTVVHRPAEFGGEGGAAFQQALTGERTWETQLEGSAQTRQATMRGAANYEVIRHDHWRGPNFHLEAWRQAINDQIRHSEVAAAAIRGEGANGVLKFLRTSRGRAINSELAWHSDPERWAGEVNAMVHQYLPGNLKEIALKRDVTLDDLREAVPEQAMRPDVHGAGVDMTSGTGRLSHAINAPFKGFYDFVGRFNNTFSRHPVFAVLYRDEFARQAESRLAVARASGKVELSTADLEKAAHAARQFALSKTNKLLFDMAGTTQLSHYMRFISPFFGAWQEGVTRWWNIIKVDPSVARRFFMVFDAPRSLGIVIDSNTGEPVPPGAAIADNHVILLQLPEAWGGKPPSEYQSPLKLSETSFNLITQGGGIFNPGFGPFIQIPLNEYAVNNPEDPALAKAVNNIMPLGTTSDMSSLVLPSSFRMAWTLAAPKLFDHYSAQYQQMQTMRMRDLLTEWGQTHVDKNGNVIWPNQTQLKEMISKSSSDVYHMSALRLISALVSPASIQVQSEFMPQIWAYRNLEQQALADKKPPFWADDAFIKKYGEAFFPLTQSSSLNHAGLYETRGTVASIKAHRSLLDKVSNPGLYRAVIGAEGEGSYDQTSRNYLLTHQLAPGSPGTFIQMADPLDASKNALVAAGWQDYTAFMNHLQLKAEADGFKSFVDDPRAADLKRAGIQQLASRNPTWFQEYMTHNDAQYESELQDLKVISQDPTLNKDPRRTDIQVLNEYLDLRQQVTDVLNQRAKQGGSSSPTAQSNADILGRFTNEVADMVQNNTMFQDYMFNGIIEFDPYLIQNAAINQLTGAA